MTKAGLALAVSLAAAWLPQAARASFIYGIADDNVLDEINTVSQAVQPVFNTGLTGLSNAFAYDTARQQFWFVDSARMLRLWNGSSSLITVAPASTIGTTQPANAAYFNNSYWYFSDATATLNRIPLTYTNPLVPTAGSEQSFSIAGITPSSNTFGNIADQSQRQSQPAAFLQCGFQPAVRPELRWRSVVHGGSGLRRSHPDSRFPDSDRWDDGAAGSRRCQCPAPPWPVARSWPLAAGRCRLGPGLVTATAAADQQRRSTLSELAEGRTIPDWRAW